MKHKNHLERLLAVCALSLAMLALGGETAFDVDAFLKRVLNISQTSSREEVESLTQTASRNGKAVAEAVALRLADKSIKEEDKVKYVCILGGVKEESSVSTLLGIVKSTSPTSMLHRVTSQTLVAIGGDKVGAFFLEDYRKNKAKMDGEQKFEAMQRLAMLQYAPAVEEAEEFLNGDPGRHYWQVYFIFGFFDDLAVPMLCKKLNDPEALVRTNALGALRFVMSDSALVSKASLKRLEVEKDPKIRYQITEMLEWNMLSQGEKGRQELMEAFGKLLKREDENSAAAKFMRETLATQGQMPEQLRSKFKPDAEKFKAAYQTILTGGVHFKHDREAARDVVYCATRKDVPKLKELRRFALYRQSDECFYDYQALTRSIQMVRSCAPESNNEDRKSGKK